MIITAHAHKRGVTFHIFPRAFKQKTTKILRPKMTKIASKGSCLKKEKTGSVRRHEKRAFLARESVYTHRNSTGNVDVTSVSLSVCLSLSLSLSLSPSVFFFFFFFFFSLSLSLSLSHTHTHTHTHRAHKIASFIFSMGRTILDCAGFDDLPRSSSHFRESEQRVRILDNGMCKRSELLANFSATKVTI